MIIAPGGACKFTSSLEVAPSNAAPNPVPSAPPVAFNARSGTVIGGGSASPRDTMSADGNPNATQINNRRNTPDLEKIMSLPFVSYAVMLGNCGAQTTG
ncbi:MAG TPA: hypothetical protein VFE47_06045 [Tepidisphaeraceae bacterium]|nr:hypothetical protein [Tepidisphaeraceae bacterium]